MTSSVGRPLPADVDPALWYDSDPCGRHYLLVGNPHTHRGLMRAYCPEEGSYTRVSLEEIEMCSEQALYFIRGFLSGNEPPPPLTDDGDDVPMDDPHYSTWRAAIDRFHDTGHWTEPFDAETDSADDAGHLF
ncbi:hypothetical protein ACFP2T_47405 [Plantactinospora solaniradicis]|uniref:Uncharacterized protein n=1 Tax=Plantactinospora solaniradicis TaxID=1723736 RepID=A0ABW1KUF4_9ACTN